MNEPLQISPEARQAALKESERYIEHKHDFGYYVQLAINAATKKLTEERDCWITTANALQKDYNKLEAQLKTPPKLEA